MSTQGSDLSANVKQAKSIESLASLASHSCTHHHIEPIVAPIFLSTVFKHHKHGSSVESGVPKKAPETTDTRTKENPSEELSKGVERQCPKQVDVQRTNVEGQCDVAGKSMNPTRTHLETCLAGLEASSHSMVLASGMAAFTVLWSLLKTDDHVLVIDDVYVETKRFLTEYSIQMGITSSFVDMNDIDETVRQCTPNTRMVWIETVSNPNLKIIDIKQVCESIRTKQPNVIVVVDNTITTPIFQRPLELGADVVLHSLTKYINGHMDVVMGAIMTNNDALFTRLLSLRELLGLFPSPFDCHLVSRGLKTLSLRMKEHQNSALKVANFLESHQNVASVRYPGLESHSQHALFKSQMKGFGGIVTFKLNGGQPEVDRFLDCLKIIQCAEGFGGYASLIEQPEWELIDRGLEKKYDHNFLRLSVGLEDVDDLIRDLDQSLNI